LEGRLNISNFAYANAQLSAVKLLIDGRNFVAATSIFSMLRRTILQSCELMPMTDAVAESYRRILVTGGIRRQRLGLAI
jgi:hypothetical protein